MPHDPSFRCANLRLIYRQAVAVHEIASALWTPTGRLRADPRAAALRLHVVRISAGPRPRLTGFVTSSYASPTSGRPIALGLVERAQRGSASGSRAPSDGGDGRASRRRARSIPRGAAQCLTVAASDTAPAEGRRSSPARGVEVKAVTSQAPPKCLTLAPGASRGNPRAAAQGLAAGPSYAVAIA